MACNVLYRTEGRILVADTEVRDELLTIFQKNSDATSIYCTIQTVPVAPLKKA